MRQLNIPEIAPVGQAYAESALWAQEALRGTARRTYSRRRVRRPGREALTLRWADPSARETTLSATLINLSEGGLGLRATEPVPLNSPVRFDAPEFGVSGKGRVRYCNSSDGESFIGIERQ
jgi:hypothetical protein